MYIELMVEVMKRLHSRLKGYAGSEALFWVLIAVFIGETVYLAIISAFQMAFDEAYHVRLIEFFASHPNPMITAQTDYFDVGNILHSPSWLYHYLLSFPYRLLGVFDDQRITIVGLRIINIGIAVTSLLVARDLLGKFGIKTIHRNLIVGLLMFTPVFTLLSAQTNYDNAVILVSFALIWLTVVIRESVLRGNLPLLKLAQWVVVASYGSLIKYSVLPVVAGTAIWIAYLLIRAARTSKLDRVAVSRSFSEIPRTSQYLWGGLLLGGLFLFFSYYGMNAIRYQSPVPQCDQVLQVNQCTQYYAWNRNYELAQNRAAVTSLDNVAQYTYHWVVEVWYQMYAQIIPTGGIVPITRFFYGSLLILSGVGVALTALNARKIFRRYPALTGVVFVCAVYLLLLWARNYHDYQNLGAAVAVQGRYMAPVLLFYYTLLVLGLVEALKSRELLTKRVSDILYGYTLVLFILFGGFVGYVLHILPNAAW